VPEGMEQVPVGDILRKPLGLDQYLTNKRAHFWAKLAEGFPSQLIALLSGTMPSIARIPRKVMGEMLGTTKDIGRIHRSLSAVLCALLYASNIASVQAQTLVQPQPLSLEAAMQIALKKQAQLQKAEALTGAAQARVTQARSGQQPSLSLQGVASRGPTGAPAFGPLNNPGLNGVPPLGLQGMAGDPVKKQFGGGLNLSQNLFDDGRTRLLIASRTNAALALEADTDTQRAQILLAVQQSYFAVLRAQRLETIQKENLRQREATAMQAKALAEGGIKSEVDALLAAANVAEAKGILAGTGNDIQASFAQLNNAMGETSLVPYRLDASPALALPETLERALTLAQSQRSELKGLALQRRSADEAAASLRRELRLRVDGIASLGAVNPGTLIRNNQNLGVAVAITLPLSTGGAVEGRITEEERRRDAYAAQEREALETVKLQVTRAWLDVQTREAQLVTTKAQIEAALAALQLAQERYRLQLSTLVELTDAEAQVLKAKLALVNAEEALALSQATLCWATGTTLAKETAR